MTITISFKFGTETFSLDVDKEITVSDLKNRLLEKSNVAVAQQRLIYKGQ